MKSLEEAIEHTGRIGYPVMLKSTAGGGGIGMRICADEATLRDAYDSVTRLATVNFNDGGVFLENTSRVRHVEVQVFGNGDGEAVALGERDCSVRAATRRSLRRRLHRWRLRMYVGRCMRVRAAWRCRWIPRRGNRGVPV